MRLIFGFVLLICGCGSSTTYQLYAPGITDATLIIESALTGEILETKKVNLTGGEEFGGAELGVTLDPIKIRIVQATYVDHEGTESKFAEGEELSALYVKKDGESIIDVNPFTTIGACLVENNLKNETRTTEMVLEKMSEVDASLALQFEIESLQGVALDGVIESTFSNEQKYRLLIAGFEQMATSLQTSVSNIATVACIDIENDGILDGNNSSAYDNQTFKARLAGGAYQVFLRDELQFSSSGVIAFVNRVSLNHDSEIFTSSVIDFPFEFTPPEEPNWVGPTPVGQLPSTFDLDFTVTDASSNPTFSAVTVTDSSGEVTTLTNETDTLNRFQFTLDSEAFENGNAVITVVGQDLFGNVRKTSYPVVF